MRCIEYAGTTFLATMNTTIGWSVNTLFFTYSAQNIELIFVITSLNEAPGLLCNIVTHPAKTILRLTAEYTVFLVESG